MYGMDAASKSSVRMNTILGRLCCWTVGLAGDFAVVGAAGDVHGTRTAHAAISAAASRIAINGICFVNRWLVLFRPSEWLGKRGGSQLCDQT
jgi:hypothetical protein